MKLPVTYRATPLQFRGPSPTDPDVMVNDLLTPCSPGEPGSKGSGWR